MTERAKIKIVYVITSTGVGGAEKILYHTATGMDCNRYEISVCSLKKKGVIAEELAKRGIEVHCLHMANKEGFIGWFSSAMALFKLLPYLRSLRPEIVHSFLFRANILARIAGFLAGVPIVISSIRVMGGEKRYYHYLERITSFMVNHYLTVSESVKKYVIQNSKIPVKKISVIYNGMDIKRDHYLQEHEVKKPFAIEDGDRILVTVGRLHKQKGHCFLFQAVSKIQKEISSVKLIVVGEGEEGNNLKNLAESLDLTDNIIFAGLRDDVEKILPMAEIFVLPSLWEGMPNVLLEAMNAGNPVIATKVGGIPELVLHGKTGILVPPNDSNALAKAIVNLLHHKLQAKKMGEAGRTRVEEHFTISKTVVETESIYQKLLKEKQLL